MSKVLQIEEPAEDDLIPQHHYDAGCQCGHRHAEHSMFGSCHGCNDCGDDADLDAAHEHAYQRCACTNFELAPDVTLGAADFALTG